MITKYNEFIHINEDAKDEKRIEDIVSKSKGDVHKELQLSTTMANSIKEVNKAYNRGVAAYQIEKWDIANIFFAKAVELGKKSDAIMQKSQENAASNPGATTTATTSTVVTLNTNAIDADCEKLKEGAWAIGMSQRGGFTFRTKFDKAEKKILDYSTAEELSYALDQIIAEWPEALKTTYSRNNPGATAINWMIDKLLSRIREKDKSRVFITKYAHLNFSAIEKHNSAVQADSFKLECLEAMKNIKFNPGDIAAGIKKEYSHSPGKSPVMTVTDPLAVLVWDELSGQISDGYWENSRPYDHWKWIRDLDVVLGSENSITIQPYKSYNLSAVNQYVFDGKEEREMLLIAYQVGAWNILHAMTSGGNDWQFKAALSKFRDISKTTPKDVEDLIKKSTEAGLDIEEVKAFIGRAQTEKPKQDLISKAIASCQEAIRNVKYK